MLPIAYPTSLFLHWKLPRHPAPAPQKSKARPPVAVFLGPTRPALQEDRSASYSNPITDGDASKRERQNSGTRWQHYYSFEMKIGVTSQHSILLKNPSGYFFRFRVAGGASRRNKRRSERASSCH